MAVSNTRGGTRILHDDELAVLEAAAPQRRQRRSAQVSENSAVGEEAFLAALGEQDLDTTERFAIAVKWPVARRSVTEPVIEVPVDSAQSAALLIKRDGVFEWQLTPDETRVSPQRRGQPARRTLVFHLAASPAAGQRGGLRGPLLDWAIDQLIEPVRVVVVKFAAELAVGAALAQIEKVKPGIVDVAGDVTAWVPTKPDGISPRKPKRVLLFLHGTFSTTAGSFGTLSLTTAGMAFLAQARKEYDLVLGYDHKTLSATPGENAQDVLDALKAIELEATTVVDIIAYSRGGLVARELVERLLPGGWPFSIGKVVFIACTNGGTALADRDNWKALLDLYTNLAISAGAALATISAGTADTIVSQAVKTLGAFVQAVVDTAITEAKVPGIAAMSPDGELVTNLNKPAPGPLKAGIEYFTITSHFDVGVFDFVHGPKPSLTERLKNALVDFAADQLMAQANDLVVNTQAMTTFGGHDKRLTDRIDWARNPVVHHCNYFEQAGVAQALQGWLMPAKGKRSPLIVEEPTILKATTKVVDALAALSNAKNDGGVVIWRERTEYEPDYFYPRSVGTLRALTPNELSLRDALDLRETDRAEEAQAVDPQPHIVTSSGWIRIVGGRVAEAILPPQTISPATAAKQRTTEGSAALNEQGGTGTDMGNVPPSTGQGGANAPARRTATRGSGSGRAGSDADDRDGGRRYHSSEALAAASDDGEAEFAASPNDEPIVAEPAEIECNFAADIPQAIPAGEEVELTVTVSREEIAKRVGTVRATGSATLKKLVPIRLEILPRANCEVVGANEDEIVVPKPGRPEVHAFKVRGKAPGAAEVWVDAMQGTRRLVRLVLQPTVIPANTLKATAVFSTAKHDLPLVELRIYEVPVGVNQFRLRFSMESRELDVALNADTDTFNMQPESYVGSLYEKLEGAWGETQNDYENLMTKVTAAGIDLYTELVPRSIREAIWEHREEIGSIEVIAHEPYIPWEILVAVEPIENYDPDEGRFLSEFGLVRWSPNNGFPPATLSVRKGQARHVIPTYEQANAKLPSAPMERKMLVDLFGSKEINGGSREVLHLLKLGDQFDLLHFGCHGLANPNKIWEASLLLGDSGGVDDLLDMQVIKVNARLRGDSGGRPIVFLNACQTGRAGRTLNGTGGMADAFVRRGAGLFVGTLWSVGDSPAFTFARTFYEKLLEGHSVVEATREARHEAKKSKEPSWLAYTVYGHPYARLAEKPTPK